MILVLALLAGGWFLQRGVAQDQNVYVQARLLEEVADHISDRFVEPVERGQLYDSAIEGMIRSLNDPNTSLFGAEAYENFRIQTEGDYGGVGLEIVDRGDHITVVSPLPGTPGFRAGIRAGDEIVEVEGESTRDWTAQQAVEVLRGRPGTDASVKVRRPGVEEEIPFTLSRERIQIRSVPFAAMLEGDVGYVPLDLFSETSTREVHQALDSLRTEGARGFVLDLRGNPGGVLDGGVGIADLFLDRGASVVETRGQRESENVTYRASEQDRFGGLPLVVLVDRGSASAAEIVAGALQDHDRAAVLGMPTFGKGSVQTLFTLTGGNVLKLTTAHWHTPRGRSIEKADVDEEESERLLALTVDGEYVMLPDTAGRPTVTSYGGRELLGGGGIVPDMVVLPDTLPTTQQQAVRRLHTQLGTLGVVVFNFAVEYLQERDVNGEVMLRDDDMARFRERMREAGMDVDDQTLADADAYLRRRIAREVAIQAGGEHARFLQEAGSDAPLRRALDVLEGAESPDDLFARVGSPVLSGGLAGARRGGDDARDGASRAGGGTP